MDNLTVHPQFRQSAIDWLNSKSRSFDKGIAILKEANYKPFVVANFEKNKERNDTPRKLEREIRLYIRYCTNPQSDNPIHEDEEPFINPEVTLESNIDKLLNNEYPTIVKQLLSEVRNLYVGRSIMHRDLKAVGESNDKISTANRQRILATIEASSRRIDTLWSAFEEYTNNGKEPDALLFEKPFDPANLIDQPVKEKKGLVLPENTEELKKMSENWRIKLLKAENRLEYQTEKKGEKANPMPNGPKRILLEKKIAQFKEEKKAIDLKIAQLT